MQLYRDVIGHGLSEVLWLPDSDRYDVALCSLAADIDFDGQNEILIGTYGQVCIIIFHFKTSFDTSSICNKLVTSCLAIFFSIWFAFNPYQFLAGLEVIASCLP